jgi:hypothetical protein
MLIEQTILGVALRFQDSATAEVRGHYAALEQRRADHQEAVALEGIFFGTHQNDVRGARQSQQAIDAGRKFRGFAARGVVHPAIGEINAEVGWPSTKRFAEKLVSQTGGGQQGFEWLAIELRKTKTGGAAADITKDLNAASGEDGKKIGNFQIRVADGEERAGWSGVGIHKNYTGVKRILPEQERDGKRGGPAKGIGILRAMPATDGGSEIRSMLR